jgi:hypothetical protein
VAADTAPATRPRVAVLSRRHVDQRVWNAAQYEFEDVILDIEDATLIAPPKRDSGEVAEMRRRTTNKVRQVLKRPVLTAMSNVELTEDVDLFFGIFASVPELADLNRVSGWREHSGKAVAFLIELWTTQLPRYREDLKALRGFDHIFLFSRDAIPAVEEITGVPCTYLPAATDTLRFAPTDLMQPERVIDVLSYGRRLESTHQVLLKRLEEEEQFFYHYQTGDGPLPLMDYREHRILLAESLKRSRYSVVYRNNDNDDRARMTGGEDSLTTRYFESAAAGALLLGSRPDTPDFDDCFSWPLPIQEFSGDETEILASLDRLDADLEWQLQARRNGVQGSLRAHDWAHRWLKVLEVAGMNPDPRTTDRIARLETLAATLDPQGGESVASH